MVHLECTPKEDKYDQKVWMCSIDGGPRYETTVRIVALNGEHIIVPDHGAVLIADVDIVIVNKEKGYTRIWLTR